MGTIILGEIPDTNTTATIATNDLALVGVNDDVVGGAAVVVAALDGAAAGLPDFDGTVLARSHHPLALAVKGDASYVAGVALEGQQRVGIRRLDVKQLHGVVAGGSQEALVRGDA